jgi:hypothetical protein
VCVWFHYFPVQGRKRKKDSSSVQCDELWLRESLFGPSRSQPDRE